MPLTHLQRETILNTEARLLRDLIKTTCSNNKEKKILLQGVNSFNDRLLLSLHEPDVSYSILTPRDIWRELQTVRHNNYLLQKTISEVAVSKIKCPVQNNPGAAPAAPKGLVVEKRRPPQPEAGKGAKASPRTCPMAPNTQDCPPTSAQDRSSTPAECPTPQLFLKAIDFILQLKELQEARNNSNN